MTPYQTLLRLLTLLSESDGTLRRSDVPALAFEVLLLRLAELPRLVGIEEFLSGRTGGGRGGGGFSSKGEGSEARPSGGGAPGPASARRPRPLPPDIHLLRNLSPPWRLLRRAPQQAAAPVRPPKQKIRLPLLRRGPALRRPDAARDRSPSRSTPPTPRARSARRSRRRTRSSARSSRTRPSRSRARSCGSSSTRRARSSRSGSPSRRSRASSRTPRSRSSGRGAKVVVENASPPGGDLTAAAAAADPAALEQEHLRHKVAADERVKKMLDLFGGEIADVKRDDGSGRPKGR